MKFGDVAMAIGNGDVSSKSHQKSGVDFNRNDQNRRMCPRMQREQEIGFHTGLSENRVYSQ